MVVSSTVHNLFSYVTMSNPLLEFEFTSSKQYQNIANMATGFVVMAYVMSETKLQPSQNTNVFHMFVQCLQTFANIKT